MDNDRSPPGSRVDTYAARFVPAFHEEVLIAVSFGAARDSLVITLPADSENLTLPAERGLQFLEELAALDPLGIPDTPAGGIDGITVYCVANEAKGTRNFAVWSPDPRSHPRQHGFVLALLRLARDLAEKPETVKVLEQLGGYLRVSPRP